MSNGISKPILSVQHLSIDVGLGATPRRVVDNLNFDLYPGQTLCIAGESGSGKSLSSLAIMGLLPKAVRVAEGAIRFAERNLIGMPERELQQLRGKEIGMIFQEPMTSLNPLMTVGQQLEETLLRHEPLGRQALRLRVKEMLASVRMPQVEKRLQQYPHELSGGMRQRVMIAMAMLCRPKVLIADEPTTALDVTIQAQILELMRELQQVYGTSLLMITHDMGVVAEMADQVVVMNHGRTEEQAPVRQLFTQPQADYTRKLLAAVPVLGTVGQPENISQQPVILQVRDLSVRFPVRTGWFEENRQVHAVEGVNFELRQGETLGLVGESGCGKSSTGKALMNMQAYQGSVKLFGKELNGLQGADLHAVRRDIQMVFQDPYAALNPRKNILELVGEPLLIHHQLPLAQRQERVAELLRQVDMPVDTMYRYPHQFSGGQRQRICIARALALNPKVIIADESVSALDVSVQAQVLELLEHLREVHRLSYLFISHDMAVVERICHRVAVMYGGQIVEIGRRDQVLGNPQHPYTKRLLSAVPMPDVDRKRDFKALLHEFEQPSPIKSKGFEAPAQKFQDLGNEHWVAVG
ncbi:ABC transporter ATP-binding protein [Pseudomonas fluorescens]|jgi:peptide/nickel transport system ATP-binding protein|uniref:ABC transporter ATP-binding protein n=1 Tax=Pseudomonas TaxID=286 RepID=UPI000716F8AC|nr:MULTISPECIES: ABC transporter ATP-binding protein [Pseudomonas]AYG07790.1 ABC transporter ATP-binding protein [Pseudomonas fluorescens]MBJ2292575.1 ABC transporter ATP-binding protein [Pseudomonas sp. MF5691]NMX35777.1 ABC transporter ATP-binding protein [Pseudomonas sp. WS 5413]NMY32840.1 ABC transporter ATP-binding protein [Pseudomonas sp. WS 5412]NMY86946.1 ABC transporter ATP-binding protein [Pseudomonas sp. WS 5411]